VFEKEIYTSPSKLVLESFGKGLYLSLYLDPWNTTEQLPMAA
jgi:hypothetical protein